MIFLSRCTKSLQLAIQKELILLRITAYASIALWINIILNIVRMPTHANSINGFITSFIYFKNYRSSSDISIPLLLHAAEFYLKLYDLVTEAGHFPLQKNSAVKKNSIGTRQMLLCTALIKIIDSIRNLVICHALLDLGSEASFISKDSLQTLCLEKNSSKAQITCLGSYNTSLQLDNFGHLLLSILIPI